VRRKRGRPPEAQKKKKQKQKKTRKKRRGGGEREKKEGKEISSLLHLHRGHDLKTKISCFKLFIRSSSSPYREKKGESRRAQFFQHYRRKEKGGE